MEVVTLHVATNKPHCRTLCEWYQRQCTPIQLAVQLAVAPQAPIEVGGGRLTIGRTEVSTYGSREPPHKTQSNSCMGALGGSQEPKKGTKNASS